MTDAPKTQDAADWSDLPRDMYVVRAWRPDGLFWCAEVAQVPHALAPEVRYTRAIPLPADDALTEAKHGERMDYTAAQLQAIGEAYAAAYADAKAKRDADDAEIVKKVQRKIDSAALEIREYLQDDTGTGPLELALEELAAARAALSAMRGEPTQLNAKMEE